MGRPEDCVLSFLLLQLLTVLKFIRMNLDWWCVMTARTSTVIENCLNLNLALLEEISNVPQKRWNHSGWILVLEFSKFPVSRVCTRMKINFGTLPQNYHASMLPPFFFWGGGVVYVFSSVNMFLTCSVIMWKINQALRIPFVTILNLIYINVIKIIFKKFNAL